MGPGGLLEFQGAKLADAPLPGIGEAAAVKHLRQQAWWIEASQCGLGMGGVGQAHGDDATVAPRLRSEPGAGVEAVFTVAEVFDEAPLAAMAAACILEHDRVAMIGEQLRQRVTPHWLRIGRG